MTLKNISVSLIIGSIVLVNVWFISHILRQDFTPAKVDPSKTDIFLENVTHFETDDKGQIAQHIKTHKVFHYPQNNSSRLEQPQILIRKNNMNGPRDQVAGSRSQAEVRSQTELGSKTENDQAAWLVTANKGHTLNGLEEVQLEGNVVIQQQSKAHDQSPPLIISTEQLTAFPKRETAQTHKPLIIKQANNIIHAVGLQADLKSGIIKLLHQVNGIYEGSESAAQNSTQKQTKRIKFQAQSAEFNTKTGKYKLLGDVTVSETENLLKAKELVLESQNNKLTRAIATGTPASFHTTQGVQSTPVLKNKTGNQTLNAQANIIEYDLSQNRVILQQQGQIIQAGNIFTSDYIIYDLQHKKLISTANKPNQTIKIILQPQQAS
jgi:lipopolysaccharide transport protein LptA